ncbi:unnamed protein product [Leptidea sinapis]|uniref:Homeobox domain-containing protein n=1 Tax=Leptidea sinapis TaxID=189913 RepID=A0A5E4QJZ2_9NEOP|nr:unnamed protein product [Leptidea sinapis]
MDKIESETKRKQPKPFSIESLIGDRKSPEIDIENADSKNSDDENQSDLNRMRYYLNGPFLHQSNFPLLLGYTEPWLSRVFGEGQIRGRDKEEDKRDSPVSVGSEESDGVEENTQDQPRENKARRRRTAFTSEQLLELEREFHAKKYLSLTERSQIASALKLSQNMVPKPSCKMETGQSRLSVGQSF